MESGFTLPDSRGVPAPLRPCTPTDAFGGGWCVVGRAKGGEPGAMLWHQHTCITPGRAKPVQSHVAFALHVATSCTGALPCARPSSCTCPRAHACKHRELCPLLPVATGFARLSTRVQIGPGKGLVGANSGRWRGWGQRGALQTPPPVSLARGEAAWERSLPSRRVEERARVPFDLSAVRGAIELAPSCDLIPGNGAVIRLQQPFSGRAGAAGSAGVLGFCAAELGCSPRGSSYPTSRGFSKHKMVQILLLRAKMRVAQCAMGAWTHSRR